MTTTSKITQSVSLTQSIVGLLVIVVTLGVSWGIYTTKINYLKEQFNNQNKIVNLELDRLRLDVHQLQIKQAGNDQILNNISEDLKEIKEDVKKIRRGE